MVDAYQAYQMNINEVLGYISTGISFGMLWAFVAVMFGFIINYFIKLMLGRNR